MDKANGRTDCAAARRDVCERLAAATAQVATLTEQRKTLLVDAEVRGDAAAKTRLAALTAELREATQQVSDGEELRTQIDAEIAAAQAADQAAERAALLAEQRADAEADIKWAADGDALFASVRAWAESGRPRHVRMYQRALEAAFEQPGPNVLMRDQIEDAFYMHVAHYDPTRYPVKPHLRGRTLESVRRQQLAPLLLESPAEPPAPPPPKTRRAWAARVPA